MSGPTEAGFAEWLGIGVAAPDDDARCVMTPGVSALGRPGVLHGGATATLLEQAGRQAVTEALGAGGPTIELASITVDYLRTGPATRSLAGATVVKLGGRVAVVGATAWAEDRARPFAAAKLTFLILRETQRD